jgi:hypothetical protein
MKLKSRSLSIVLALLLIVTNLSILNAHNTSSAMEYLDWNPYHEFNRLHAANPMHIKRHLRQGQYLAEELLDGQKVYISLTTINQRLYGIADTIRSITLALVVPSHIYLIISKDPYLLDTGVSESSAMEQLAQLIDIKKTFPFISVIYSTNIGSHRKLLPLLRHKWYEDCVIITVDDHEIYKPNFLAGMLQYYIASGRDAVVAMRCRRLAICRGNSPLQLAPYFRDGRGVWPEAKYGTRELLTLPTGIWGVLYRPQFFDENVIFDRQLVTITKTGDDLMFRIATLSKGITVITACTSEMVRDGERCPVEPPKFIRSPIHGVNTTLYNLIAVVMKKPQLQLVDVVSSSHGLRRNLAVTAERRADPRKQVSLATKYNEKGGNDMMWREAANYLKARGVFDFDKVLEEKFPVERGGCTRNCINCLYSLFVQWRDRQCGIVSC